MTTQAQGRGICIHLINVFIARSNDFVASERGGIFRIVAVSTKNLEAPLVRDREGGDRPTSIIARAPAILGDDQTIERRLLREDLDRFASHFAARTALAKLI